MEDCDSRHDGEGDWEGDADWGADWDEEEDETMHPCILIPSSAFRSDSLFSLFYEENALK
ncbi:MAG: hypothetical protein QXI39_04445 [Candidatus Bathyarchaeia archaeon]